MLLSPSMAEELQRLELQIQALTGRIDGSASPIRLMRSRTRHLLAWHRDDAASQRLATIPRVDVIGATALAASVTDPVQFRPGRKSAASLGLVPRQNSSGGRDRFGRISLMEDRYLRKLLVVGATSVVRRARTADTTAAIWVRSLLDRKPVRLVTVAMANKTARVVRAMLARGDTYRSPACSLKPLRLTNAGRVEL